MRDAREIWRDSFSGKQLPPPHMSFGYDAATSGFIALAYPSDYFHSALLRLIIGEYGGAESQQC